MANCKVVMINNEKEKQLRHLCDKKGLSLVVMPMCIFSCEVVFLNRNKTLYISDKVQEKNFVEVLSGKIGLQLLHPQFKSGWYLHLINGIESGYTVP